MSIEKLTNKLVEHIEKTADDIIKLAKDEHVEAQLSATGGLHAEQQQSSGN